jgi:CRISPR-associated exonuclease Cas4
LPTFVVILLLCALLLIWISHRIRRYTGLPDGRVVYADTAGWDRVQRSLFSERLGLSGKPDYIVYRVHCRVPVEVKSGSMPAGGAYRSHQLQLAAYCLLAEEHFGARPTHGLIKYDDGVYTVDYSPELEHALIDILGCMRADLAALEVARSHRSLGRCRGCGLRDNCTHSLA